MCELNVYSVHVQADVKPRLEEGLVVCLLNMQHKCMHTMTLLGH